MKPVYPFPIKTHGRKALAFRDPQKQNNEQLGKDVAHII